MPAASGEEHPARPATPTPARALRKRSRRDRRASRGLFICSALRGNGWSETLREPVVRLVPAQLLGEAPDGRTGVDQGELGPAEVGEILQVLGRERGGQDGVVRAAGGE